MIERQLGWIPAVFYMEKLFLIAGLWFKGGYSLVKAILLAGLSFMNKEVRRGRTPGREGRRDGRGSFALQASDP